MHVDLPTLVMVLSLLSPVFAAGGAYAAVRTTLKWHWAEIQRAHTRLDRLENRYT
jgi:hypothetical protein